MAPASLSALVLGAPGPTTALALHAWLDEGHRISGFLCCEPEGWWREDRRLARLRPRLSVTAALRRAGCEARLAPPAARDAAILAAMDAAAPDLLLSVGFRRRVGEAVLARLPRRAVNIHPALLPACAGPTPSLCLLLDDAFAEAGGATLHLMDPALDGGPIIARRGLSAPFPGDVPAYRLASGVAAAALAAEALPAYLAGARGATPQPAPAALRRATDADLTVGPGWSRARIERLARALPWSHALLLPEGHGTVAVAGAPRFLPPGAGPAPPGFAQAPCEGGVVRFRRRRGLDKRLWRWRQLLRLVTAPLPPPGPELPP
ncbi:MAG: formyltransferase family protein [Acetobacteraceae bacterium]